MILIVDDDMELLTGLDDLLSACGHFTVTATTALEAIQVLQCTPVDLVLSDVDLPGGSGYDVAACAGENEIPVILMSGAEDPGRLGASVHAAVRFLRKPFLLREVLALVDDLLAAGGSPAHAIQWEDALEELVRLLGKRDRYTYEHSCRVQRRATMLARAAGLPPEQVQAVSVSALLHDVGLIAVPLTILNKPGPLTPTEQERLREHPVVGETLLRKAGFPPEVLAAVRSHHERWDGRGDGVHAGYPDGLAGEQIVYSARLLAVVIAYDAMLTPRAFRRRFTPAEAMDELDRQSGQQYDPEVIRLHATLAGTPHF